MGGQRRGGKRQREESSSASDEEEVAGRVVFLSSSSDDEEANVDLSLEIVQRARKKREEGTRDNSNRRTSLETPSRGRGAVIDLSSTDEETTSSGRRNVGGTGEGPPWVAEGSKGKKKMRKKKQKKEADEEGAPRGDSETADDEAVVKNEEELATIADSIDAKANGDISDNIVLRKLLRGPRYFDPGSSRWESCYNCGEEGHVAANCTAEKRKKPCFVCGMFGHNANKCTQGQDCFICKRRGHFAKDCPDKHQKSSQDSKICLRCGGWGHDLSSCGNAYPSEDLEKIQCYVCKGFGHFCCVDFIDTTPREVSCYNCGDSGHSGMGCAKPRGESSTIASHTLCYICGEEGHFARGCTRKSKSGHRLDKLSTTTKSSKNRTTPRYSKSRKDSWGSKSLPRDFRAGPSSLPHSKVYKKRSMQHERRGDMATSKSRIWGGWIVDDPSDFPKRGQQSKSWKSPKNKPWKSPSTPRTPVRMSYKNYNSAGSSYWYHV